MRGSSKRAGMLFLINLHVVLDRDAYSFFFFFFFFYGVYSNRDFINPPAWIKSWNPRDS